MSKSDPDNAWLATPKVLLHDHLDGGLRVATIIELAAEIGYRDLPTTDPDDLARWFHRGAARRSLELYLETFAHTVAVMSTPEAIERVAFECGVDLAADGVVYAEPRVAPELMASPTMSIDEVIAAIGRGLRAAEAATDITLRLIVCSMRDRDISEAAASAAVRACEHGVVGFDIAGAEAGFPAGRHHRAFEIARAGGLGITIHAGEAFGLASIEEALRCGATRLGHGVRIIDDVDGHGTLGPLARRVRDEAICLEVCPTSNVHTAAAGVTTFGEHPIDRLADLGFAVTVNTDNRLMSDVTVSSEYRALADHFGWDDDAFARANRHAVEAAFCDDDTRRAVRARLSPAPA